MQWQHLCFRNLAVYNSLKIIHNLFAFLIRTFVIGMRLRSMQQVQERIQNIDYFAVCIYSVIELTIVTCLLCSSCFAFLDIFWKRRSWCFLWREDILYMFSVLNLSKSCQLSCSTLFNSVIVFISNFVTEFCIVCLPKFLKHS